MPTDRFTFTGSTRAALAARLDMPHGPHLGTAIFAHCFTCGKDIPAARRISARLAAMGFAVLRFDFTGLGHSGGEFQNTSFTSNVGDLLAAARALEARGMPPALLIGHSLGGAAVLKAAGQLASVKAVATIGAPFDPGHVIHNFGDALDRIAAEGAAEVNLGGRPIRIGQGFVEDVTAESLNPEISNLKKALLILHAPQDAIVGIENATEIYLAAKHPKSFVTLDDADHLVTRPADAEYAADVIATWVSRYVELRPPAPPPGAPEGITRVSEADPKGFLQDVQAGPYHHARADEPLSYGGTNKGLTPYQFLAAGLGACTSMTVRMYARRKNWHLAHISVDVSHNRVHAQDARGSHAPLDTFTRAITLTGPLDVEQRTKLLEIADKCPVHQSLAHGAHIVTTLVPAEEATSI
ncbi:MAG: OsmC family protein [Rhodobacteraceae bacterium]|nr:OsmC family protein [Paracoccaceae bacterium]